MSRDPAARDELVAAATGAWRPRDREGRVRALPEWHDLDPAGREQAFAEGVAQRALEAALDPRGLTTTGHAVLARIRGARSRGE